MHQCNCDGLGNVHPSFSTWPQFRLIDGAFTNAILAAGKEQHILPYEAIALSDTNFKAADTARAWVTETACAWHLQKASPFDEPLQEPPVCIGGHWRRHQQLPCKQDDHEDNGRLEG